MMIYFDKRCIKLDKMISQVNRAVTKKCEENGFHLVSNDNILRKHLCKNGVHLTDEGIYFCRKYSRLYQAFYFKGILK